MGKIYKRIKEQENYSKNLCKEFNLSGFPARVEPNLFLIVDTDELQKQVNRLENMVNRMDQIERKRRWRYGGKNR